MPRAATGSVVTRMGKHGTTYGLRFRAYGKRHYLSAAATSEQAAEVELANVLADVRRGLWQPPRAEVVEVPAELPLFHETEAGRRTVDLSPDLRDELLARKAAARSAEPGDLVFPTRTGTKRDRHNVRARVLTAP